MKKHELTRAIFEQKNQLYLLNGQGVNDLEAPEATGRIRVYASRHNVNELESELKGLTEKIAKINHDVRVEAFYATPEGAALKTRLETEMRDKQIEWGKHELQTSDAIESLLIPLLGEHWAVCKVGKGWLEIGIINAEKTDGQRRAFYSGQTLDIRYEEQHWIDKREVFKANCGGCGEFGMEGGATVGEQAMFHIGVGRLLGDPELVASLKAILKESARTENRISAEHKALHDRLENPLPEVE